MKPIVMMPKVTFPTLLKHELVVVTKTEFWKKQVRRRLIKGMKKGFKNSMALPERGRH